MLPGANPLSSRAQNCHFCALLAFGTPVFRVFEHKNGIFVRFCPPKPPFSSISSTKSGFLCQNGRFSPCFRHSRAQNCHFCARVTGDAYRDVGLEVVNVGFGKRKARIFWVCALLLICLAARSAVLPEVPFCSERHSTRSSALPGVPPHHLLARKRRAGEQRAGERRAVGFTGGRG